MNVGDLIVSDRHKYLRKEQDRVLEQNPSVHIPPGTPLVYMGQIYEHDFECLIRVLMGDTIYHVWWNEPK